LEAVGAVATSSPERFECFALAVRRLLGPWEVSGRMRRGGRGTG
jgi:hypothetical protein